MFRHFFFLSFWLIIQVFNLYLLPYFHFLRYSLPRCFSPSYFQVDYKKFKERIFVISFEQSGLFFRESTKKNLWIACNFHLYLLFLLYFALIFLFPTNKYFAVPYLWAYFQCKSTNLFPEVFSGIVVVTIAS